MRDFNACGLSALVLVKKLESRYGLLGFARLVKLLELVAEKPAAAPDEPVVLAWADVLESLQVNDLMCFEFLAFCENAKALRVTRDESRLQLKLCGELDALMANAPVQAGSGPVLFETPEQWAEWFATDLGCPPHVATDPLNRQRFRRWCATNVTVTEVEAAIELAIKASQAPTPTALHEHLRTVRTTKIERAAR